MFSNARRYRVLLMERRKIDGVSLVEQQRGDELLLRRGKTGQVEVIDQIGGVLRRAFEIDAQANFMKRTALTSKSRLSGSSSQPLSS